MHSLTMISRDRALEEIPDSPATVEFRQMAEDAELTAYRSGGGLLLANNEGRMLGAMGQVIAADAQSLLMQPGFDGDLVADEAAYERLCHAFPLERAIIQTLDGPWQRPNLPIPGPTIRSLATEDSLDHLPEDLRAEIEYARSRGRILAGFIDAHPVGFAYVVESAAHADMSIDTLEDYRNRGIATAVAAEMVDLVVAAGKRPVWGAVESNRASLRLAEKLGFRQPAGTLYVAEEPLRARHRDSF
ncbi:MAG: GNAT family N-acetyltransferase [Pirellulales bacterium]